LWPPQTPPPANSIFYNIDIVDLSTPIRGFADVPAGSDFQCPMCTSAEPYCFTEPTGDLLATVETLERCSARAAHAYGGADNVATELATPNMMT